ncbi:MAG TPA: hypothetical protein VLE22_15400 [Bryobacteraceae bacterium]|nr:hypothetical protein [Bryobacteraceae bacterium]
MTDNTVRNSNVETPLESWKEVAAYLQRDVRTVIRWEKSEGLPVHRHHHLSRSSVYAYPSELDAWRANRKPLTEITRSTWRQPMPAFASVVVIALSLMMVGSGPYAGSLVEAADGIVTRRIWKADLNLDGAPSPDGRYLAFDDETGNLAVRDLTTGEVRRLTNGAGGWRYAAAPVFSPDAERVAFGWRNRPDTCELRVAAMDSSEPRVLYRAEGQEVTPTDWSLNGSSLLVLRRREPSHSEIVTVAVADGSLNVLKSFDGASPDVRRLRISPDGRFVAYDLPVDKAGNRDIFVLTVAGGQVSPLVQHTAQEQFLGWTPDGRSVLFLSDRTGNWGAWLIPVANGKPQAEPTLVKRDAGAMEPLGFKLRDLRWLQWSPRGNSLLVRGRGGLYTIDARTEAVSRAPWWPPREYGSYIIDPCWSADEKAVYYVEPRVLAPGGQTRLLRADLVTGREVLIHLFPKTVTGGAVLLSPNGDWFLLWLLHGTGWSPAVMPANGTEVRDLPGPWSMPQVVPRSLTWGPHSNQVVFIKHPGTPPRIATSELWGVPAESGEQRSLGFSVGKDVQFPVSIHPDGKRLAFTAWEPATEIWVMENFLLPSSKSGNSSAE